MSDRVPKCLYCNYWPTHVAQGYYRAQQKCMYRVAGYDCRRFIPPKDRSPQLEAQLQADRGIVGLPDLAHARSVH